MRCLVDECLSPALSAHLRNAGHDAIHVVEAGLAGRSDTAVMDLGRAQMRIVISADTDFGELLARSNDTEPSVVLYRGREVDPVVIGAILLGNLDQVGADLATGAIVVLLDDRIRVKLLPVGVERDP